MTTFWWRTVCTQPAKGFHSKPQVVTRALAIYNSRNPDKPKTSLGQTWWINFMEQHNDRVATQTINFTDRGAYLNHPVAEWGTHLQTWLTF
ncbi:hypothetical protein Q5P01_015643 [Channa striata]|uniref:HTH CENPB-type domain-containing protein n=1 Tax=Channa striata TaxID=64152 RepID=A0AA88MDN4_CHASR|nr:hypothetical protein Q5P01_015643 [Channa striata]